MYPNNLPLNQTRKGEFQFRKFRGDICTYESPWTKNVILIGALDALFSDAGLGMWTGVRFGAGNTTPAESQSALVSVLGVATSRMDASYIVNATVSPKSITQRVVYRGAEGAVVGNVAELGLYTGAIQATRALLRDEFGAPTTVPVASDEFVEVEYRTTTYAIEGATGTLTINALGGPLVLDYEIQPVGMSIDDTDTNGFWNRAYWSDVTLGATVMPGARLITTSFDSSGYMASNRSRVSNTSSFLDPASTTNNIPPLNPNQFSTKSFGTYVAGSKTRTETIRLALAQGNIAAPGIRSLFLAHGNPDYSASRSSPIMLHQVLLEGPFKKLSTQVFDLPVTTTLANG